MSTSTRITRRFMVVPSLRPASPGLDEMGMVPLTELVLSVVWPGSGHEPLVATTAAQRTDGGAKFGLSRPSLAPHLPLIDGKRLSYHQNHYLGYKGANGVDVNPNVFLDTSAVLSCLWPSSDEAYRERAMARVPQYRQWAAEVTHAAVDVKYRLLDPGNANANHLAVAAGNAVLTSLVTGPTTAPQAHLFVPEVYGVINRPMDESALSDTVDAEYIARARNEATAAAGFERWRRADRAVSSVGDGEPNRVVPPTPGLEELVQLVGTFLSFPFHATLAGVDVAPLSKVRAGNHQWHEAIVCTGKSGWVRRPLESVYWDDALPDPAHTVAADSAYDPDVVVLAFASAGLASGAQGDDVGPGSVLALGRSAGPDKPVEPSIAAAVVLPGTLFPRDVLAGLQRTRFVSSGKGVRSLDQVTGAERVYCIPARGCRPMLLPACSSMAVEYLPIHADVNRTGMTVVVPSLGIGAELRSLLLQHVLEPVYPAVQEAAASGGDDPAMKAENASVVNSEVLFRAFVKYALLSVLAPSPKLVNLRLLDRTARVAAVRVYAPMTAQVMDMDALFERYPTAYSPFDIDHLSLEHRGSFDRSQDGSRDPTLDGLLAALGDVGPIADGLEIRLAPFFSELFHNQVARHVSPSLADAVLGVPAGAVVNITAPPRSAKSPAGTPARP